MSPHRTVRVVVAEDERLILQNMVKKIRAVDPAFDVVGVAEDGKEALDIIESQYPDLLVTDIRMPWLDGLELARIVALYHPYLKTIVVSGFDDFQYAQKAIQFGVKRYLLKPLKAEELRETLRDIRVALDQEEDLLEARLGDHGDGKRPLEIADEVETFIRRHFDRKIDLDSVARGYAMSSSQLCKLWRKVKGDTPVRYLKTLRMNEARHLLAHVPGIEVKTVGGLVGYPDQFYFSRVFKSATGKSPSEFREESRG
jgi:two-component system response regulator YesN